MNNIIESFNSTINYIETVLCEEIEERKVLDLSGYSLSMFSRIFSILTDMTLSEYIRYRKLTKAAIDLRETKIKVIDVAIKYGYESSNSFANAFKRFHGNSPIEVRKGANFNVVSCVQLSVTVSGGRDMNISIQRKRSFKVAGIKSTNIDTSECSNLWEKFYSEFRHDELAHLGNGQMYGMCYDVKDCNNINYMVCYDVKDVEVAKKMGLEIVEIEESEYAILSLEGKIPESIHNGWKYAMEVFFPQNGYMHSGTPDFEVYGEGNMDEENYKMELWIPIVKVNK